MRNLPLFFQQHTLSADADERAIKRAYARKLKQIDQETDLHSFQELRETYEVALAWLARRDAESAREKNDATIDGADTAGDSDADVAMEPQKTDYTNSRQSVEVAETTEVAEAAETAVADSTVPEHKAMHEQAKPQAVAPEEAARQVFEEMLKDMRAHADNEGYAGTRFSQAMDDERLIHMETRLIFEKIVAHYLLQGWQSGDGELFDSVVPAFNWEKDRRRLFDLGGSAYILDRALTEAKSFRDKDKKARAKQWALLTKIRKEKSPKKTYLKANLGLLRHIQDSYPTWLHIVTSREHLAQWAAEAEEMRKSYVVGDPLVLSKQVDTGVKPVYWIVIICVILFGMLSNTDKPRPRYQGGQPAPVGQIDFSLDTPDARLTSEQRIQKAEALLSMSSGNKDKFDQAVRSLESAASVQNEKAAYRLGWLYRDNKFTPPDIAKQYAWFLRAADLGHLQSRVFIGDYFLEGWGGKVDYKQALHHFKIAADKGNKVGQFKLAYMIDHGLAIKKDKVEVARLIKASADQALPYSESLMGQFHLRGEYGVEKNEIKAADWFSLSAQHGDASGARYFGLVNEKGMGNYKINLAEAAKWYGIARDHDDKEAEKSLQKLCKKQEFPSCTRQISVKSSVLPPGMPGH